MGIVDTLLAEFHLLEFGRCQVEQDVNGTVHIHLGGFRIELSEAEFVELVDVVEEGQLTLYEIKDFDREGKSSQSQERGTNDAI